MTSGRNSALDRLTDVLIRIASRLAPRSERLTWTRQWEAELAYLRQRTPAGRGDPSGRATAWAALGAVAHALWLRGQDWRPDMLLQDARFAVRNLVRRPLFASVVVLTIALGIGVNAAVFSVLFDVVLQPLPYDEPDELVMVWEHNVPRENRTNVVAPANFFVWREDTALFEDLSAITWFSQSLTATEEPERLGAVAVNANFFPMLGVQPHIGRFFLAEEDDPASTARPVVLGHDFWLQRFGGREDVLGTTLELNDVSRTVIGVLPPDFSFDHLPFAFNATPTQDVWMPQAFDASLRTWRGRWLQVVGRLADGVSLERAQNELATVASRLEQEFPDGQAGWTVNVVPLQTQIVGDTSSALYLLFGAVTLVLLIACGNVANLLLSRSAERSQEFALRTALGADRLRVVRQLLTESGLLAIAGGGLGLLLAFGLLQTLVALNPDVPRLNEVGLDVAVVTFTIVVSCLTGLFFGLAPAVRGSSPDLTSTLKEGGSRASGGKSVLKARNALVVTEIALALLLLVGSGLLIRSFASLMDQGVGFDEEGVITAEISLPSSSYADTEQTTAFFERAVERVAASPGIVGASAITNLPLSGSQTGTSFWANDRELPRDGELPVADVRWVHRDYHQTLGIPILRGRTFDSSDSPNAPLRVVINEGMADRHWPDADPIGRTISMPWGDTLVAEIIGVAGNVRHNGPDVEPREKTYWHHLQWQERGTMSIVARTAGDPTAHASTIRTAVRELDPTLPLYNVHTMRYWVSEAMAARRFIMLALVLFASVALVLATIGVYGVMSYNVSQRTQEFGVRLALGARTRDVTMRVVVGGLKLVLVAIGLGTLGALGLSRLLQGLVYGVGTTDWVSFAAAGVFLTLVALAACYWPAHRAGRTDPLRALRSD